MVLLGPPVAAEWAVSNSQPPPAFPSEITSLLQACPFRAESTGAPLLHAAFLRKCGRARDASTGTAQMCCTAMTRFSICNIHASRLPPSAQNYRHLHLRPAQQTQQNRVAMCFQQHSVRCRRYTHELILQRSSLQSAAPRDPMDDCHSSQSSGCCRFLS